MKKFFGLSMSVHLLLLLGIPFYLVSPKIIKNQTDRYIPSYLSFSSAAPIKNKENCPKKIPIMKKTMAQQTVIHTQQQKSDTKKTIDNILLKILHNKIADNLSYPDSALMLKQNGTVKIGLLLFPNGQLTHISILKSSGVTSMDSAAIAAVQSIPVIEEAHAYLSTAEFFSVDVVFQT